MSTELERQLEDSLWALVKGMAPAHTDLIDHLPHLAGGTTRVKRVYERTVLVLCPCKTVLKFNRCFYIGHTGQCEEETIAPEATLIEDARCGLHKGVGAQQVFLRCDYYDGQGPDGRCINVAVRTDGSGRHWCSNVDHDA